MDQKPRGRIKAAPEDFLVEEIPAYAPSGAGDHLYVHFRKRNRTTDDVVRHLARALGANPRDFGVPGLKDKVAVTTQWISVPATPGVEERLRDAPLEGVEILETARHNNKLRTGHLRGNRFKIVVRDVSDVAAVEAAFAVIQRDGVPNAFGGQRFGRDGDNATRALEWLRGKTRAPKDPRARRFDFSAFQSAVFNDVLAEREKDGTWNVPVLGDLLRKDDTGGLFVCTDVQADRERARTGELCPTGPIVGDKMRQPDADVLALETRILAPWIEGVDLHRARSLGEGTRRPLRLRVDDGSIRSVSQVMKRDSGEEGVSIALEFVLAKGAYATTVLARLFDVQEGVVETTLPPDGQAELSPEEE